MKKILLMFVALLCATIHIVAYDRVTDLSMLSNDKLYFIKSERAFLLYSKNNANDLSTSTGSVGSVTMNMADPNQQFKIEKKDANYYLYSVGAGKYVGKDGKLEATASTALNFTPVNNENYPWKLCIGNQGMNTQVAGQAATGIMVNSWTTTDAGNCFYIEEAIYYPKVYDIHVLGTEAASAGVTYGDKTYGNNETLETEVRLTKKDFAPTAVAGKMPVVTMEGFDVYVSYFDEGTKFYTIQGGHGGYVSIHPDYMDGNAMLLTNAVEPTNNQGLWAFVKTGETYKVYNYSTGLTKALGITGTEADARTSMVDPSSSDYKTDFSGVFKLGSANASVIRINGTGHYWNKRENYLALWETSENTALNDTGCKFYIREVDTADFPDEYIYEVKDITGVTSFTPKNPNTLWYKTSAEATGVSYPWMEYALPIGNGELGAMIFGGVHNEEIQFNEKTLWSGPANVVGAGGGNRTFMNFGSVIIENKDNAIWEGVTDYVRYLDIEDGIAGVAFKNGNGSAFTRKYLSSAPDQVIAAQYKAEGSDKMNLVFKLKPGDNIGASEVVYENGQAYFTGTMTVKHAARLHVVADNEATVTTKADRIIVENATNLTFYLKGATNFNGDMEVLNNYFTNETAEEVNTKAKSVIEEAIAKGYDAVEADHIADFNAITKRMTFSLGLTTPTVDTKTLIDNYYPNNGDANSTANDHLFLEQLYFHFGRYLAISSNRKPIAAPNNLQGIWNDRGTDSPWNSDVHTNINIQMNYWPTEITNLSDLHKPFVNFIIRGAQSTGWKEVGTRYNNGHGWSVLTETSLYNSMSTWGDNYLVANVWYTSHLWTHWRYTQDKEFLKKAFPVMWDCAKFWFHRLIEDRGFDNTQDEQASVRNYHTPYKFEPDGTFVAPDEFSAEQHDNQTEDGTAHAQQMISYLFQNLADAIEILGVENTGLTAEDVAKLNLYLEKTDKGLHTETYTGAWGETYNGVNKGEKLLREWKYTPFDISNDRGHRHMSHLMALFPMDQITPESEYFTPAVNSLKLRGDVATGWSMGWKVNLWARAQDGDHAHIIIKNALKHSTDYGTNAGAGGIYYNLFDSHAPFQIDGNFGVCSGIAEMLMQSAHGYINILPALPEVWKKQGTVTGMKAIGNFTVDFNWEAGQCQQVKIVSHAGAPLRIKYPNIAKAVVKVNGSTVAPVVCANLDVIEVEAAEGDIVTIDFTAETTETMNVVLVDGETYEINEAVENCQVTYKRNFQNTEWQALYVPFAMPYDAWKDNFEVAQLSSANNAYVVVDVLSEGATDANVPYLIKSNEAGEHSIVVDDVTLNAAAQGSLEIDEFVFTGTYTAVPGQVMFDNKYYAMSEGALKQAQDETVGLGSYRWYLAAPAPAAQTLRLAFDGVTAIDGITVLEGNAPVYDLHGRRVSKSSETLKKGVYISNGQKIIIK
ncbi:MAG: glycoside hydrolase family 95 protein [Bacteroidaceae bacterium]|nr:glycoside hydrolase family 95 protein [Bacteroidaceae bacterium]